MVTTRQGTGRLEQFLDTHLYLNSGCSGDPVRLGLLSKGACALTPMLHLLFGAHIQEQVLQTSCTQYLFI